MGEMTEEERQAILEQIAEGNRKVATYLRNMAEMVEDGKFVPSELSGSVTRRFLGMRLYEYTFHVSGTTLHPLDVVEVYEPYSSPLFASPLDDKKRKP